MRPTKADPQGAGSAITYARRYGLLAMCGIAPEDDDANDASKPQSIRAVGSKTQRTTKPPKGEEKTAARVAYEAHLDAKGAYDTVQVIAADFRIWAHGLTPTQVIERLKQEAEEPRLPVDSGADSGAWNR